LFTPLLSPKRVFKFFAVAALYGVPVILTAVLLYFVPLKIVGLLVTVPCIYLAVRFKFFPYVVIENEEASLKTILQMSFKTTQGHFWKVFGFLLLAAILNILGVLVFIVGLVITVPVSIFATAYVYDKLKTNLL
jgi:uncharacterized membrane protein